MNYKKGSVGTADFTFGRETAIAPVDENGVAFNHSAITQRRVSVARLGQHKLRSHRLPWQPRTEGRCHSGNVLAAYPEATCVFGQDVDDVEMKVRRG